MLKKLNPLPFFKFIIESDLLFPLILILVYAVFWYLSTGIIPTTDEIISSFGRFYERYGYEIVFAAALIESLILVGLPAPGGAVLALGAVFARTGETNLFFVILFAIIGSMVGYTIDYFLGYYGFSNFLKKTCFGKYIGIDNTSRKFSRKAMFLSFFYGNIGSVTSLAAGSLKYEFKKFFLIAFLATTFWATFWGLLIFSLGTVVITILSRYIFIVVIILIIVSYLVNLNKRLKKS